MDAKINCNLSSFWDKHVRPNKQLIKPYNISIIRQFLLRYEIFESSNL